MDSLHMETWFVLFCQQASSSKDCLHGTLFCGVIMLVFILQIMTITFGILVQMHRQLTFGTNIV